MQGDALGEAPAWDEKRESRLISPVAEVRDAVRLGSSARLLWLPGRVRNICLILGASPRETKRAPAMSLRVTGRTMFKAPSRQGALFVRARLNQRSLD